MKSIHLIEALMKLLLRWQSRLAELRLRLIRAAIHSRKRRILVLDTVKTDIENKQRQLDFEIYQLETSKKA